MRVTSYAATPSSDSSVEFRSSGEVALWGVAVSREPLFIESVEPFNERWRQATRGLDGPALMKMNHYRRQMELEVLRYLVLGSPILLVTVIVPILAVVMTRQLLDRFRGHMNGLDSTALMYGGDLA